MSQIHSQSQLRRAASFPDLRNQKELANKTPKPALNRSASLHSLSQQTNRADLNIINAEIPISSETDVADLSSGDGNLFEVDIRLLSPSHRQKLGSLIGDLKRLMVAVEVVKQTANGESILPYSLAEMMTDGFNPQLVDQHGQKVADYSAQLAAKQFHEILDGDSHLIDRHVAGSDMSVLGLNDIENAITGILAEARDSNTPEDGRLKTALDESQQIRMTESVMAAEGLAGTLMIMQDMVATKPLTVSDLLAVLEPRIQHLERLAKSLGDVNTVDETPSPKKMESTVSDAQLIQQVKILTRVSGTQTRADLLRAKTVAEMAKSVWTDSSNILQEFEGKVKALGSDAPPLETRAELMHGMRAFHNVAQYHYSSSALEDSRLTREWHSFDQKWTQIFDTLMGRDTDSGVEDVDVEDISDNGGETDVNNFDADEDDIQLTDDEETDTVVIKSNEIPPTTTVASTTVSEFKPPVTAQDTAESSSFGRSDSITRAKDRFAKRKLERQKRRTSDVDLTSSQSQKLNEQLNLELQTLSMFDSEALATGSNFGSRPPSVMSIVSRHSDGLAVGNIYPDDDLESVMSDQDGEYLNLDLDEIDVEADDEDDEFEIERRSRNGSTVSVEDRVAGYLDVVGGHEPKKPVIDVGTLRPGLRNIETFGQAHATLGLASLLDRTAKARLLPSSTTETLST